MAITMTCPRCTHKNNFEDGKAGQKVHCRICHHQFALPGTAAKTAPAAPAPAEAAKSKTMMAAPAAPPATTGAVKEGAPRPGAKRTEATMPKPPATRRSDRRDDDDDDRDRPSRGRRKSGSSSSTLYWVLGSVGAVLVLGCCGVVSIGVLLPAMGLAFVDKQIAAIEDAPPQIEVNQGGIIINPPVGGNPAPPIVFNPPPPPVPKLDPRNADDGKEALTRMKNGGPEIDEAFRWLRGADLNHPLRRDFAKQMEMMVDQEKTKNNDLFFEAYFRWANSEDNFDSLMRLVKDTEFTVWQNARRQNAMKTLGRLKEARAADAITQRLGNVFDRGAAIEGMTKMGPAGVPTLLKYMHDPEGEQRNQVRELLKRMDVSNEQLFTQTLTDLKSTDDRVQNAAVEWLSEARAIDEKRRPEVSRALDPMITPQTLQQGPFFKALERWGTKENGLTIAKNLDGGNVFKTADALKLLGKLKDPRTLPVLASRLGVFGFEGNAAKDALRQFGADAEPEVCKVLLSPDQRTRHEACQLLGDIGTAKISGAAMQRACNAYPQDRQLDTHAKRSWLKIKARGG